MKRLIVIVATALLVALSAGPVLADSGAPGSTYPEQPGTHVQNACQTILSLDNQAFHQSSTAASILGGLVVDACFGG